MNNDRYFQDHLILSEKEVNKREQALKEEDLKNFITEFRAKVDSDLFEEKLLKYIKVCIEGEYDVSLDFNYPGTDDPYTRLIALSTTPVDRISNLDHPRVIVGAEISTNHGWITEKEYKHLAKKCYDIIQDRIKELGFKVKDDEHYEFKRNMTNFFQVRLLNK